MVYNGKYKIGGRSYEKQEKICILIFVLALLVFIYKKFFWSKYVTFFKDCIDYINLGAIFMRFITKPLIVVE